MNRKLLIVTVTLLTAGCAHRRGDVDPNFYDYQWSKVGATQEAWMRDKHDCEVEADQRSVFDQMKIKNSADLSESMCRDPSAPGCATTVDYGSGARRTAAENAKRYWPDCMEARQWRADKKFLAAEDNEQDISSNINTFKPPKEQLATKP
jgi:hypothetical protein